MIGILGLGHIGEIHLKNWIEIVGKNEILFYEPNIARSNEIESKYAVSAVDSTDQLIEDCDAIDIVTPTNTHFELARKAMLASKHIFVEKPICETTGELSELMAIQEEKNLIIQVGFVERYNPAYKALFSKVQTPKFFEVHRLAPFTVRGSEVSVIMDLMIHDIDIIVSFVDSPVRSISANGVAIMSKTPDIANARIEFENGVVANLTASRISMKKMRKMRIFSENMYSTIDFLDKKAELYEIKGQGSNEGIEFLNSEGEKKRLVNYVAPFNNENAMKMQLSDFLTAVNNYESAHKKCVKDYMRSLEIALSIQKSILTQPQHIN
jgi:predicted dehydrogenase